MWIPTHCHSHFSLLDGLSKPEQIAARCVELGYKSCALSDHGVVSGIPSFFKACKAAGIKPISACEFYVAPEEPKGPASHLVVLAKNKAGWTNLIRAVSEANRSENFYRKPRLRLEQIAGFSNDTFITFSGHLGSDLADIVFKEPKLAYRAKTYEDAKSLVREDWKEAATNIARKYQKLFGASNFYLEIQLVDQENLPAARVVGNILRYMGKHLGIPCLATADSHYCRREDAADQRVILCTALNTTMKAVQAKLDNDEDVSLGAFFRSSRYHIPSLQEMQELHTEEELANSIRIADQCEEYTLAGSPHLPVFDCPNGREPNAYMRELCRKGWSKVRGINNKVYSDRVKHELEVLEGAGLAGYFLIVQDYVRYAREELKCRIGVGRGSAAGCLVSYLLGITNVDPIKGRLIFERFYNAGRNSPGRVALPDIDVDFPIASREKVIDYIRKKYGEANVAQMVTFGRMQGRSALKDVLRVKDQVSFEEMNRVTSFIPDEAKIADELQEMEDASILRWALENHTEELSPWCSVTENGFEGPLAVEFEQAIRLEGTKRSSGKHASGLIISASPLSEMVPMVHDKSGQMLVGVDMRDAEEMGLVKFDILGLRTLDCIQSAESIIRTGKCLA